MLVLLLHPGHELCALMSVLSEHRRYGIPLLDRVKRLLCL